MKQYYKPLIKIFVRNPHYIIRYTQDGNNFVTLKNMETKKDYFDKLVVAKQVAKRISEKRSSKLTQILNKDKVVVDYLDSGKIMRDYRIYNQALVGGAERV